VSQWPQIQPIRAALAIKPGKCELMDRGTGPWGYTITQSDQVIGRMNQKVDCLTVQSIIDQFESKEIDILKLDIEGGELDLFLNPDEWIDRVRSIVVELHDRIAPGCSNAFESATRDFPMRFRSGEKQIVYRENWNQ
jgi:FkbM family methyltransferase